MFIIAQIPFVDFRLLSNKDYEGSFFPNMFDKNFEKDLYYRFLGREKNRFSPNGLPMSERRYFDSRKILYLKDENFCGDVLYLPQLLFARFFEDKQCFHFDIGLREIYKDNSGRQNLSQFTKDFLCSHFFGINRKYEKEDRAYSLIELTKKVKEIYLYATASKKKEFHNEYSRQVVMGFPALFITYDKNELHSFGMSKEVQLSNGITARHELVSVNSIFVDAWYIGKNELSKYNQDLRNLRIYLSKLHSYKESTRIILDYLDKEREENINNHKVGTFFNYMLNQMNRKRYYGYENDDFWKVAFSIDNEYNCVSWDEFRSRIVAKLREIEMSTGKKYENVQIINAGDMDGIVNIIGPSAKADINISVVDQDKLEELIQEFENLVNELTSNDSQITEEQKNQLSDQAQIFKDYATSKNPDKNLAGKLFKNVKNAICFGVTNSERIQRLLELGEKITALLK